ncbi:peptidylprolyl isomerase [Glaciimonas soli]|uniref:peptidylprolyl isomerase n=1 Tax=Glaciimonas soli TaxID=2590999 RepID=A0A843YM39_9BURK|nr:peptidyl-prolyl cis-trans isomerase [Glaciimonas soli]MQQ99969.1 peptidylprolyl isomerase [Glaciimonas soli]
MTFKPAHLLVVLFAAAAIPAFAQNVAVVNGKAIPSSQADMMIQQMTAQNGQKETPELRKMVNEELINREVMVQEAEKQGLANNTDVKGQLAIARQSILIRALAANYIKKNPVSDADVTAEYNKFKAAAGDKEYHAQHILVDSEQSAKDIIAQLKAGKKFEDLAKQSKDPGSADKGGDLGWANPSSFVPEFGAALKALKPGQVTDVPVKTQFGWHVIKMLEVRPAKIPTLAEVKPQITEALQQKKLQAYEQTLRASAKVQ